MSQAARLLAVLQDYQPHRSDELTRRVYDVPDGVWLARLGARVYDLKRAGHRIRSYPDPAHRTLWYYQLLRPEPQPDLFPEAL